MGRSLVLFLVGCALVLGGGLAASLIQGSGGISVSDVRIALPGTEDQLSGLLYVPPGASEANPAPAVLATHGYINSRETQSGFAIEFARQGFVVLAIDQTGHGFSDGAAFSAGFGGPAALAWLRAQPMVDADRIGLEGHSMGGWTSLAAASAMPDAYRSVALVGSSTGAPFAAPGTTEFPRNAAVIFSTYDEFAPLMWGVEVAADVESSEKLRALFGTEGPVRSGQVYGDVEAGTARWLAQPVTTHPGDHLSATAIADAASWMDRTLGAPTRPEGQVWFWKELGTLAALIGGMLILLGSFGLIARPIAVPTPAPRMRGGAAAALMALVPAITYYPLTAVGAALANIGLWPQNVTNQIMVWALGNGLLAALAVRRRWRTRFDVRSLAAVLGAASALYAAALVLHHLFLADMRFWVVALKPMAWHHLPIFFAYLVPFTLFFYASQHAMARRGMLGSYPRAVAVSAGGLFLLLAIIYVWLLMSGALPSWADPLFSIVLIQFVPVLAMVAVIAVFALRRTGGYAAGALLSGILITWYIVAGQATHVV